MYAIMEQGNKKTSNNIQNVKHGKSFFLLEHTSSKTEIRNLLSEQVANTVSNDMKIMAHILAKNIIEGVSNGKR